MKKPEAYRPAPKKREPAEQRQSHKAGILLTVLIICAAVLAVLLLRSLGVFGTPTTAETTPTPDRLRCHTRADRDAHTHPDAEAGADV